MDNQDHKVEFLNELSQEHEREPDAPDAGVSVTSPRTLEELVEWIRSWEGDAYSRATLVAVARRAHLMGLDDAYNDALSIIRRPE